MTRGDLVHIPQGTLLLQNKDSSLFESEGGYIKAEKPMRALFWDKDPKKPSWGSIYYKDNVWDVRMRDIYPISQELGNVS